MGIHQYNLCFQNFAAQTTKQVEVRLPIPPVGITRRILYKHCRILALRSIGFAALQAELSNSRSGNKALRTEQKHSLKQGRFDMLKIGEPMEGQQAASYREIRIFVGGRSLPIFFQW